MNSSTPFIKNLQTNNNQSAGMNELNTNIESIAKNIEKLSGGFKETIEKLTEKIESLEKKIEQSQENNIHHQNSSNPHSIIPAQFQNSSNINTTHKDVQYNNISTNPAPQPVQQPVMNQQPNHMIPPIANMPLQQTGGQFCNKCTRRLSKRRNNKQFYQF